MWIHPFSSECVVVACFSVASKEGDNSSWDYESQCSPQSAAGINVRREEPDSAFGSGLALLFLTFCLVTQRLLGFPVKYSPSWIHIMLFYVSWGQEVSYRQWKNTKDFYIPRKVSWRIFDLDVPSWSRLTVNWTKAGLMWLCSWVCPAWKVQDLREARCLDSYVIIHSVPPLYFGASVISFSIPLSGLGWDRSGS